MSDGCPELFIRSPFCQTITLSNRRTKRFDMFPLFSLSVWYFASLLSIVLIPEQ